LTSLRQGNDFTALYFLFQGDGRIIVLLEVIIRIMAKGMDKKKEKKKPKKDKVVK
jgi:hypothetical protein